jgi:hypothetical protein
VQARKLSPQAGYPFEPPKSAAGQRVVVVPASCYAMTCIYPVAPRAVGPPLGLFLVHTCETLRDQLAQQFAAERGSALPAPGEEQCLLEFQLQAAMLTRTTGHGDPEPQHTIWRDD